MFKAIKEYFQYRDIEDITLDICRVSIAVILACVAGVCVVGLITFIKQM